MTVSIVPRCIAGLLLPLLLACGSSNGGTAGFPITSPVANVCTLLTLSEAQGVVPTVNTFAVDPTQDTADSWSRICHFANSQNSPFTNLDLVIQGALTDRGGVALQSLLSTGLGSSHTAVSGVGEQAVFFDQTGTDQGLIAKSRGYLVDVTVYFASPAATAQQLTPAVNAAIGRLP